MTGKQRALDNGLKQSKLSEVITISSSTPAALVAKPVLQGKQAGKELVIPGRRESGEPGIR